jgi:hypothetical protein
VDELDPKEAARTRRRDRDATAEDRDLMRPGMGKVFKQIGDRQAKDTAASKVRKTSTAGRAERGAGPPHPTS